MATSFFKNYFRGYEILGELGRGNARVLKARSVHTGELVAIKHFAFNTEADTLRRFQRESEIMKSIQHHNIVKIQEVHLDAELPYIVMQLVEGGDLRSLLRTRGALDVATVIRLAHHMTEALDAIHRKAVVHRDVKPENIMYRCDANGALHFLLTDFGIAKLREQSDGITVTGSSMLTYEYASPEQFNQSRMVAAPTDYYSLGVVLYECLTGNVPFAYVQDDLLMHIHRVISAPPPAAVLPDGRPAPAAMQELLFGLMEKQPAKRISDHVSVRGLLHQAAFENMPGVKPLAAEYRKQTYMNPALQPVGAGKKRELTVTAGILLLICAAVFFSWTTLVRSNPGLQDLMHLQSYPPETGTDTAAALPETNDALPVATAHFASAPAVVREAAEPKADSGIALINGIYFNDFSDPEDSLWNPGKDEHSEFNLTDGKYIMKGLADSLSYSTSIRFNLDPQKNFTVAANTTHWGDNAGNPFGISFCGDEGQDACYIFYITSDGYYSIGASIKGEWNVLADWTASANIRPNTELNILSVEKQGDSLRFLINGRVETELPWRGAFGNYFGLRVDGAQTVSFDQFIVKGTQ